VQAIEKYRDQVAFLRYHTGLPSLEPALLETKASALI
jgi:hypothetical protein